MKTKIAIVARYPFYFQDIFESLSGLGIDIYSATDIKEIQEARENGIKFDYIFFPHYSRIVPVWFLAQNNCIGFHTGDLPKDRGGSPIQHKILRGEYFTFVSALKLIEKIDAGDIICREKISLEFGSIEETLKRISKIIAQMIFTILTENPVPIPQVGTGNISHRFKSQDSEFDLSTLKVREIYDRIRMLDGLDYPSARVVVGSYTLLMSNAQLRDGKLTFVTQVEEK